MHQLWSRNFTCMFLTNLFLGISFYILMGIIPLYVTDGLLLSEAYVGLIMGAFSVASFITRPFAGLLLDSFGRMKVLLAAIIIFILCCSSYLFAVSFAALFIIRTIHGLGWGLTNTSGSTIAADVVPISRRGEGLGFYAMAMSIGMALGPAIGVTLLIVVPFKAVFALSIVLAVIALCTASMVRPPKVDRRKLSLSLSSLIEKRVLGTAFILFCYGMAYGSIMGFVLIYGKSLNIHSSGFFFMVSASVTVATRFVVGKAVDRKGAGIYMGFGLVFVMCCLLTLSFAKGPLMFFGAALFSGAAIGTVMQMAVIMAMNVVEPNRRGAANATVYTALDLGLGIGAVSFGKIAAASTMSAMYLYAAGLMLIPIVFYVVFEKRHYDRQMEGQRL